MSKKKKPDLLEGLGAFLNGQTYKKQLEFWEAFRARHKARIARTEAPLVPAMLKAVDERIILLRPLAATEV